MARHPSLLLALTWTLCCCPVWAESRPDLDACRSIANPEARLRCYDEAGGMSAASDSEQDEAANRAADDAAVHRERADVGAETPDAERESAWQRMFGKREPKPGEERREIRSRIIEVGRSSLEKSVITLANGQVWMENERSRRAVESDQEAVIRKDLLSYTMILESGRRLKVHRVR